MKPLFVFEHYEVKGTELQFNYSYRNEDGETIGTFSERYVLPVKLDSADPTVANALELLHVIIGVSYYKSLLGAVQHPYKLSPSEAAYLNTVYDSGLGEYAYVNKLTDPIRPFVANSDASRQPVKRINSSGALLGIGGGKDSIVAAELAKLMGLDTTVLDVATRDNHGQAGAVMTKTALPELRIKRYVDTNIGSFTEQHQGKNGHVPISVIFAWLGILLALSTGKRYVMMANEASASVGNVMWNGREVNHQWAKSFEAELLTQQFVQQHISPDIWYFSPIREFGSLAVLDMFAKTGRKYFDDFTSCNLVLRIDPASRPNGRWCTQCAKCLSTWLLLSPWIGIETLTHIYGRNLLEDISLRPLLESLVGLQGHKPLDCVGTTEELRAVTRLLLERSIAWPLLDEIQPESIPGPSVKELVEQRGQSSLPPELQASFRDAAASLLS